MYHDFHHAITSARDHLLRARRLLNDEISAYPTPVSGCDAQYNHLLAERQKVLEALRSLNEPVFVPTPRTPTEGAGIESR